MDHEVLLFQEEVEVTEAILAPTVIHQEVHQVRIIHPSMLEQALILVIGQRRVIMTR